VTTPPPERGDARNARPGTKDSGDHGPRVLGWNGAYEGGVMTRPATHVGDRHPDPGACVSVAGLAPCPAGVEGDRDGRD
jgi:hypothetical protein